MNTHVLHPQYGLAVLTLLITPTVAHAMSGMELPHSGHAITSSPLSKSMGEPINSSKSEIEMTYSADGKTANQRRLATGQKLERRPGAPTHQYAHRRGTLSDYCVRQLDLL